MEIKRAALRTACVRWTGTGGFARASGAPSALTSSNAAGGPSATSSWPSPVNGSSMSAPPWTPASVSCTGIRVHGSSKFLRALLNTPSASSRASPGVRTLATTKSLITPASASGSLTLGLLDLKFQNRTPIAARILRLTVKSNSSRSGANTCCSAKSSEASAVARLKSRASPRSSRGSRNAIPILSIDLSS